MFKRWQYDARGKNKASSNLGKVTKKSDADVILLEIDEMQVRILCFKFYLNPLRFAVTKMA